MPRLVVLTPAERRAVTLLVLLLALGAASDWIGGRGHARRPPRAPADRGASAARTTTEFAPAPIPPASSATRVAVDLNRATGPELEALPGVGPVLAGRILEQRRRFGPFRAVEDLRAVRGVGPRLLERLRPHVTVGPAFRGEGLGAVDASGATDRHP